MPDPRITRLAEQLITYSVDLQPGEIIYLEVKGLEALDLGRELVRVAQGLGIAVHDHLIICRDGHYSFREHGNL